jgi:hypothetical protein
MSGLCSEPRAISIGPGVYPALTASTQPIETRRFPPLAGCAITLDVQNSVARTAAGVSQDERLTREDQSAPLNFCPVCSRRLQPQKCKLRCLVCGYYMSCSDYY